MYEARDELRLDPSVDPCLPRLTARAIEAVLAETTDARAHALVGLASDLRRAGRPELALHALDAAWELCPTEEPRRAAFTCALEVHCDLGNYEIAETIEAVGGSVRLLPTRYGPGSIFAVKLPRKQDLAGKEC